MTAAVNNIIIAAQLSQSLERANNKTAIKAAVINIWLLLLFTNNNDNRMDKHTQSTHRAGEMGKLFASKLIK